MHGFYYNPVVITNMVGRASINDYFADDLNVCMHDFRLVMVKSNLD